MSQNYRFQHTHKILNNAFRSLSLVMYPCALNAVLKLEACQLFYSFDRCRQLSTANDIPRFSTTMHANVHEAYQRH